MGAKKQEHIMLAMRAYLTESGVGHTLIDKMMSHASNDIYWLNDEEVLSLGTYSPGVEEQLISRCGYDAKLIAGFTSREYIDSTKSGMLYCISDYLGDAYRRPADDVIRRMRSGWRPWDAAYD